jgi:hypothetical protein
MLFLRINVISCLAKVGPKSGQHLGQCLDTTIKKNQLPLLLWQMAALRIRVIEVIEFTVRPILGQEKLTFPVAAVLGMRVVEVM